MTYNRVLGLGCAVATAAALVVAGGVLPRQDMSLFELSLAAVVVLVLVVVAALCARKLLGGPWRHLLAAQRSVVAAQKRVDAKLEKLNRLEENNAENISRLEAIQAAQADVAAKLDEIAHDAEEGDAEFRRLFASLGELDAKQRKLLNVLRSEAKELRERDAASDQRHEGTAESVADLRKTLEQAHRHLANRVGAVGAEVESHHRRTRNRLQREMLGPQHMRIFETRMLAAIESSALMHGDLLDAAGDQVAETRNDIRNLAKSLRRDFQDLMHDQLVEAREEIDELTKAMHRDFNSLRSNVVTSTASGVAQVEALLQLLPRVDTNARRFPATGGWAMRSDGILLLSDLIQHHKPVKIVEIGSGSSTVWMAHFASQYGGQILSLDHSDHYAEQTRSMLEEFGLTGTAKVELAELRPTEINDVEYQWYSTEFLQKLQPQVDMVIVDGPPKATGEDARYPAIPLLSEYLADSAIIVMDDYQRKDEQHIASMWMESVPGLEPLPTPTTNTLGVMVYKRPTTSG